MFGKTFIFLVGQVFTCQGRQNQAGLENRQNVGFKNFLILTHATQDKGYKEAIKKCI